MQEFLELLDLFSRNMQDFEKFVFVKTLLKIINIKTWHFSGRKRFKKFQEFLEQSPRCKKFQDILEIPGKKFKMF